MFAAIVILLALPILDVSRVRSNAFRPVSKFFFWLFVANFLILGWIGGNHAEEPFITIGQVSTVFYFSYFLILVPGIGIIENTLIDLATKKNTINSPPYYMCSCPSIPLIYSYPFVSLHDLRSFSTSSNSITPAKSYLNSDLMQNLTILENKGKSGVYRWVNVLNGNSYIGSSINISKRLCNYYNLSHLTKSKMTICKALLKYGYINFSFEVLEYCDKHILIKREQYHSDLSRSEFNIKKIAGSSLGFKHTKETIEKMSEIKLG